jgi:hypothetical protein
MRIVQFIENPRRRFKAFPSAIAFLDLCLLPTPVNPLHRVTKDSHGGTGIVTSHRDGVLVSAGVLMLVAYDDGITMRERSRDHRRGTEKHSYLGSQLAVAIPFFSRPGVGICGEAEGQMVDTADLADQTVDSSYINSSAGPASSRAEHVTSRVSMSENQNTSVADSFSNFASVFGALESLAASGWRLDHN